MKTRGLYSFYWILVIAFFGMLLLSTACNKDDDSDPDEYYVKYEVNSSTIYFNQKLEVIINSETGSPISFSIDQNALWETIIGPVQKDFNATLSVTNLGVEDKSALYTNISVSKNDSPFALKASDGSDTPRNYVELNYTIDY